MNRKTLIVAILFSLILVTKISFAQTNSTIDNMEKLSKEGLSAAWATRMIVDIYFDKESLITNGSLDTNDRNFLLNSLFPQQQYKRSKRFVDIILDGALEGKFKTFDYVTEQPLTIEQIKKIYSHTDSTIIAIPDPPYERDTVIKHVLDRDRIIKYHVMIDWIFDSSKNKLTSKIIAIAPCVSKYDYDWDGSFKGYYPLFWIYF